MWSPPAGGAVAALLGLAGTGLLGEYEIIQAQSTTDGKTVTQGGASATSSTTWQLAWRDVRGPMEAFGHERDATNSPVPTVIPPLGLSLAGPPVTVENGYASLSDGRRLGGAAAFRVRWSGMLLVENEGEYAFHAGSPTPNGELPDFHRAESSQWRVILQRGPKTILVLNHQWPGETGTERRVPRLRRGAYRIVVEFAQPAPDPGVPHPHRQQTSFQLKYAGPDSCDKPITLPLKHLYRDLQNATLDTGISFLPGTTNAKTFLNEYYTSTLRDMRRTYQRAFKAVLFCGGLGLSAKPVGEAHQSELGYMLAEPTALRRLCLPITAPEPTASRRIGPTSISTFCPSPTTSIQPPRCRPTAQRRRYSEFRPCSTGGSGCSTTYRSCAAAARHGKRPTYGCCSRTHWPTTRRAPRPC